MMKRLPVVTCGFLLAIAVGFLELAVMILAEARYDGWRNIDLSPMADALVVVAPFGAFPFVTALLVAFVHITRMWNNQVNTHNVITCAILAVIAIVGCAMSIEIAKSFLYLNGWRGGNLASWTFHSGVVLVLALSGLHAIKQIWRES